MTVQERALLVLQVLLVAIGMGAAPRVAAGPGETKAQELRRTLPPAELKMMREELAKMKSPNRWVPDQQTRYLKTCEKQQKQDPSINRRFCECVLEVLMDRFKTFGEYAKFLVDSDGRPDEQISGMTGACLAVYGT